MKNQPPDVFNWEMYTDGYTGGTKLVPNNSINNISKKTKVFCRENYAQELYDLYSGQSIEVIKKDLREGDIVRITDIFNIKDTFMDVELSGGLTVTIDLNREKKFIQAYGYTHPKQFTDAIKDTYNLQQFIKSSPFVYISESTPSVKISLWYGYLKSVKDEFIQQISNPSKAYKAKIIQANRGGFFVEVQGLDAFMPGSLAAPNKIVDFQSYIGKEILVMVEDFLKDMNSFVVSHKKYLAHIIPIKIQELDLHKKYSGVITGTSKFGIFVEFKELFTGLLHTSKMNADTKSMFNKREFKAGNTLDFFISEITKDNRIILTEENPEEKVKKIQTFIVESNGKVLESTVVAVMNFGVIVNVNELGGLIPISNFKRNKIMANNFAIGDKINIMFDEFKDEKLVFKLTPKD